MHYLNDSQVRGLEGLWQRLCDGKLPARCTKAWFFETFCGIGHDAFNAARHEELDARADIGAHLNGFVKPYDVVALMRALPELQPLFPPSLGVRAGGAEHALLVEPAHAPSAEAVRNLLRDVFAAVVRRTAGARGLGTPSGTRRATTLLRGRSSTSSAAYSPRSLPAEALSLIHI